MTSIKIAFARPLLLLLLIPALAGLLFPFFRLRAAHRRSFHRIAPLVLRIVASLLLILCISGFHFIRQSGEQSVLFLLDLSDSIQPVQERLTDCAKQIFDAIAPETPKGIIVFAEDQIYSLQPEESADPAFRLGDVLAEATDLAAALRFAAEQFPGDRAKKILLFSDGKETDGDATAAANDLFARGIRVDTVYFDTAPFLGKELQISSFTAPEGIYLGDDLHFTAEIESNFEAEISLLLQDNGLPLDRYTYHVTPGSNLFEMTICPEQGGEHIYKLELFAPEDRLKINNQSSVCVEVTGSAGVLIVADSAADAADLEEVLSKTCAVTTVSCYNAPNTVLELCRYDEVILVNVNAEDLPWNFETALQAYVSNYGRTLLTVGGRHTYMYGNMKNTGYEEMLPVSFDLTETLTEEPVALMLILDCSLSMQGTNLPIAKQGAIKCVEAMSDQDYVGIISFNRTATLESPLIQATPANKELLSRVISSLGTAHGTYYAQSLQLACKELRSSPAPIKHVMFLSDGQPGDNNYYAAAEELRASGVTVSTIGIRYSSEALSGIAEIGAGRNYYVSNTKDLPDIMLSEAQQAAVNNLIEETFRPKFGKYSELVEGISEASLPTLDGYIGTTLREDATAYLLSDDGKPLFSGRDYGNGKVVAFMSDLTGEWSKEWFASAVGQELINRMVTTSLSGMHKDSSITVSFTDMGKATAITVETSGEYTDGTVKAELIFQNKKHIYVLDRTGNGIYKAQLPTEEPGVYSIRVLQTDKSGKLLDFKQTLLPVSYRKEYDCFTEGGKELLAGISDQTGGICTDGLQPEALTVAQTLSATISFTEDPSILLTLAAAILLLLDIIFRKLRLKDLRYQLDRIFRRS